MSIKKTLKIYLRKLVRFGTSITILMCFNYVESKYFHDGFTLQLVSSDQV